MTVEFTTSEAIKVAKVVFADSGGKEQETTATKCQVTLKSESRCHSGKNRSKRSKTFEIKDVVFNRVTHLTKPIIIIKLAV